MKRMFAAITMVCGATFALAQGQGVSKTDITVGTIQDLSGPIAGYGKAARNGMQLRVDEINEQGGIHGRKVTLLVEDSAYDPKRAVLAAQKLVNQDKIFALLGHMGTPTNNAAMPVLLEKNIPNFLPITASKDMYEPLNKLKYAAFSSYTEQMMSTLPGFAKERGIKKPCTLYQDDDFGLEVQRGAEAALKTVGLEFAEKTSYKRGATDFSSQVARMKGAGCDLVVLGTIIRETIGAIGEAKKTGFNPVFFASFAAYTDLIHKLGGKAMDGFYAVMTSQHPYLDEVSQPIRFWATKYQTRFNEEPTVFSVYGYQVMDVFLKAAQKAGANLTLDNFVKAMDSLTVPPDMFGAPQLSFTPTKHLGSDQSRLSQIVDGRWKVISGYPNVK